MKLIISLATRLIPRHYLQYVSHFFLQILSLFMRGNRFEDPINRITYRKLLPYGPVGFENYHWDTSMTAIMEGKAAMSVEASALAGEYENPEKSRTAGKLGYAPLPSGPAGAYSGVWGWGLGVKKTSKNHESVDFSIITIS